MPLLNFFAFTFTFTFTSSGPRGAFAPKNRGNLQKLREKNTFLKVWLGKISNFQFLKARNPAQITKISAFLFVCELYFYVGPSFNYQLRVSHNSIVDFQRGFGSAPHPSYLQNLCNNDVSIFLSLSPLCISLSLCVWVWLWTTVNNFFAELSPSSNSSQIQQSLAIFLNHPATQNHPTQEAHPTQDNHLTQPDMSQG